MAERIERLPAVAPAVVPAVTPSVVPSVMPAPLAWAARYPAEHPVTLWLRNHTRTNTQVTYARALAAFARFLAEVRGKSDLMDATFADVLEWREALAGEDAAGPGRSYRTATIVARLRAVSALYGHLVTVGDLAVNPVAVVNFPEITDARFKRSWRVDEIIAFMSAIPVTGTGSNREQGLRDRALFWLLFRNGLRVSEALGARVGDVQEMEGQRVLALREHGRADQHIKGGRARIAVLKPETAATLDAYLAARGFTPGGVLTTRDGTDWRDWPLFAAARHSGAVASSRRIAGATRDEWALSRRHVARLMRAYAADAGLDPDIAHPHAARMTAIMALVRAGVDVQAVMTFSGHRTLRAVQAYFDRAAMVGDNAALRMPY